MKNLLLLLFFSVCITLQLSAQQPSANKNLVQLSGMVLDGSNQELLPIPYTNILVKGKGRGTYSDFRGFFTIVVQKTDTIVFSAIGYQTVETTLPKNLKDDRYSMVQLMTQDTFNLPETVVFPWPSRDHFKLEFLAMDVTKELQSRAAQNVAQEVLEQGRSVVQVDGPEAANYYMRQQTRDYYFIGQTPPMNIYNPLAWKKFFDAWKNGDYKKKNKNKK